MRRRILREMYNRMPAYEQWLYRRIVAAKVMVGTLFMGVILVLAINRGSHSVSFADKVNAPGETNFQEARR
jgi:hypothetical protein